MARCVVVLAREKHGTALSVARPRGHLGRLHRRAMHGSTSAGANRRSPSATACLRSSSMNRDPRTLTKAELAELLFERVGLNKREAKDIVDTFFEEIRESLARGEEVKLSGFGNFQVR